MNIQPDRFALTIAACNAVGAALKAYPKIPNRLIPVLLLPVGVVAYFLLTGNVSAGGVAFGAIAALSAVGIHGAINQANEFVKEKEESHD